MINRNLAGLNIIITRPSQQSASLKQHIIANGGNPILFPTLKIEPIKHQHWDKILDTDYDIAIFTSSNAVNQTAPHLPKPCGFQVAAIGPATKQALLRHQIGVDAMPKQKFDSEHLLATPPFNQAMNKKIVIFSGEGGRTWLQKQLEDKGANVLKIPVYKRVCPTVSADTIAHITHLNNCIVIATSCESLENLSHILSQHCQESWILTIPVLVISERMMQFALTLGLQKDLLLLAENATDQAILECLIKWYPKGTC